MGVNSYDDIFGQKAKQRPNLFRKLMNYGIGAAKVIGSVGEGLTGNPMDVLMLPNTLEIWLQIK